MFKKPDLVLSVLEASTTYGMYVSYRVISNEQTIDPSMSNRVRNLLLLGAGVGFFKTFRTVLRLWINLDLEQNLLHSTVVLDRT